MILFVKNDEYLYNYLLLLFLMDESCVQKKIIYIYILSFVTKHFHIDWTNMQAHFKLLFSYSLVLNFCNLLFFFVEAISIGDVIHILSIILIWQYFFFLLFVVLIILNLNMLAWMRSNNESSSIFGIHYFVSG